MNLKSLMQLGVVMAGFALLSPKNAPAQTNVLPPPSSPRPPNGYPGYPGMPPGRLRAPGTFIYMRTLGDLRMVKREMQRASNDFGGHRDSAIAACDKAIEEIQAVQAAVQASMPHRPPMAPVPPQPTPPESAPAAPPPASSTPSPIPNAAPPQ